MTLTCFLRIRRKFGLSRPLGRFLFADSRSCLRKESFSVDSAQALSQSSHCGTRPFSTRLSSTMVVLASAINAMVSSEKLFTANGRGIVHAGKAREARCDASIAIRCPDSTLCAWTLSRKWGAVVWHTNSKAANFEARTLHPRSFPFP
jgi:hypothetical protein